MSQPNPNQIYVPVRADGHLIRDNGGDIIATTINPVIAQGITAAINRDAERNPDVQQ